MKFLKRLFSGRDQDDPEPQEPELSFARAMSEMAIRTQSAVDLWGMDKAAWNADLDAGTITFSSEEKGLVASAAVQVVGSFNTDDGSWLWGWDHPSVPEALAAHARRVRAFGEQYGLEALVTRRIAASMEDAWRFTALASYLSSGQGCYCGPSGAARFFMTFASAVTIASRKQSGSAPAPAAD
ncbi:MAG: hypothetical protein FWD68_16100 [Alphaproteobacteria bacterium]|nr:hypothetical protein [Alphaproteobacteria bacterium]